MRDAYSAMVYSRTIDRLARGGIKDPTGQIVALAEEIEEYRAKIRGLEERLQKREETTSKRVRHFDSEWPYIETRPTCSDCGAPLGDVAVDYEHLDHTEMGRDVPTLSPKECPKCGAKFAMILFVAT